MLHFSGPKGLKIMVSLLTLHVVVAHEPLANGKVPVEVAIYLAGGSLTAFNKSKEPNCDVRRPIAVGEVLYYVI